MERQIKHTKCYVREYPRPGLVRPGWRNLNGEWDFKFDYSNEGEGQRWYEGLRSDCKINVPFVYQVAASGITQTTPCNTVWYERTVEFTGHKRQILHFEGCDYRTKVWVNGKYCGTHTGGYSRFSFEITDHLIAGKNRITVKAEDSYSCVQPRGKQRWRDESFGCWYEDATGIWKTVWLEEADGAFIESFSVRPDLEDCSAVFKGSVNGASDDATVMIRVSFDGNKVCTVHTTVREGRFKVKASLESDADIFKIRMWSHFAPNLYDVEIVLYEKDKAVDTAGSYFGMVQYELSGNMILQNKSPIYLKMLLDQGYYLHSGLTPDTEEALYKDILLTKEAGFNGIRKHQKIDDERFYYYCDILGVIAWCEMPSAYEFAEEQVDLFTKEWVDIVKQLKSFPSIMAWVPFNESWGINGVYSNKEMQSFTEGIYHLTKSLSPDRPVISNDGWEHTKSDIVTLHYYEQDPEKFAVYLSQLEKALQNENVSFYTHRPAFAKGYAYSGQPVMISEYGGIAFKSDEKKGWGYGESVCDQSAYAKRLEGLTKAIMANPMICGYCLTQTTDVRQEVNGILTETREWKIPPETIREINKKDA